MATELGIGRQIQGGRDWVSQEQSRPGAKAEVNENLGNFPLVHGAPALLYWFHGVGVVRLKAQGLEDEHSRG